MRHKAGAVFAPRITEWFDPDDARHLRAWACLERTGHWPYGFVPVGVWHDDGWRQVLKGKVGVLHDDAMKWVDEYARLLAVVSQIDHPGFSFSVEPVGEDFVVCVVQEDTDLPGRRVFLPPKACDRTVAVAAFDGLMTCLAELARRKFFVYGEPVFHYDRED